MGTCHIHWQLIKMRCKQDSIVLPFHIKIMARYCFACWISRLLINNESTKWTQTISSTMCADSFFFLFNTIFVSMLAQLYYWSAANKNAFPFHFDGKCVSLEQTRAKRNTTKPIYRQSVTKNMWMSLRPKWYVLVYNACDNKTLVTRFRS